MNVKPEGPDRQSHSWHLRKEITVGNLVALSLWICSSVWYVAQNEARLATLERRIEMQGSFVIGLPGTLARLEETMRNVNVTMTRMDEKFDSRLNRIEDRMMGEQK